MSRPDATGAPPRAVAPVPPSATAASKRCRLPGRRAAVRVLAAAALGVLTLGTLPSEARAADPRAGEYILVSGGPALREWEDLRAERYRHDRWWGNFVRAARIRMQQLHRVYGESAPITWLVYRPGYVKRGSEEGRSLVELVHSVRDKYGVRLVWFDSGDDVIRYLNTGRDRRRSKVTGFEFFGHSNRHCFMFDYSCDIIGVSTAYLHENQLGQISRSVFDRDAYCHSYGCHTGESMSEKWRKATGVRLVGAVGKTDYSECWRGTLPHINRGYWKR